MNEHEDMMGFEIEISDDEVKTLYYAVTEAIRVWPGSPARPPEEQEKLQALKMTLFGMIMDMQFDRS